MTAIGRNVAAPYLRRDVQEALGGVLRPGGFTTTERALKLRPLPTGARVLDVGCGLGSSVTMLRERYGLHAFGIDASIELLCGSDEPFQQSRPLACADATAMPLQSSSLDGVFFECSLSLCPDHHSVLAEAARILRPGAVLVVNDIYRRTEGTPRSTASGCLRGAHTRRTLLESIAAAGFRLFDWEDHSRLLADCAARLAFAGVPASAFFGSCGNSGYCAITARDYGYALCIAEKEKTNTDPHWIAEHI